jgi:bifunctional oligoribonuclease and PAP phosphatase NrnA
MNSMSTSASTSAFASAPALLPNEATEAAAALRAAHPSTLQASMEAVASLLLRTEPSQSIVITSHQNGDGDSIGSSLGLYGALRLLGKTVRVVHPTPVPSAFGFVAGAEAIETFDAATHTALLAECAVLCVLDANAPSRMRQMESAIAARAHTSATTLVLDHHQDPQSFADLYVVDVESSSTCELIVRLVAQIATQISAEAALQAASELASATTLFTPSVATALYTGIMTDTGNFRFPRTDGELHRMVGTLIEAGADPTDIYERVMNQNPLERSRLLGRALATMEMFHGGTFCMMSLTREDFRATQTTDEHIEGFVEQTLSVRGVQMGALVVELEDQVKISLRSKGTIAVNRIAAEFGGGGHLNAAGCRTTQHTFAEVRTLLVGYAQAVL